MRIITAPRSRSASAGRTIQAWRKSWNSTRRAPAAIRRDLFAMGDAEVILRRLSDYIEAGASKFILRPIADGDADMLAQTKRLVEEVLPQVAARWPKQRKAA